MSVSPKNKQFLKHKSDGVNEYVRIPLLTMEILYAITVLSILIQLTIRKGDQA